MPLVSQSVFRYSTFAALASATLTLGVVSASQVVHAEVTPTAGSAMGTSASVAPLPISPVQIAPVQISPVQISQGGDLRPLAQGNSLMSIDGGKRLMSEASAAVSAQNYPLALEKLKSARQVFNQISNFYQEIAGSFTGVDSRVATSQRDKAVDAAQLRDEATYQLALVHRAQNEADLAVPLLVQIVRSQNPTQDLGKRAYQQLFELGFVDVEYPRQAK
jgi:hypothetical protein